MEKAPTNLPTIRSRGFSGVSDGDAASEGDAWAALCDGEGALLEEDAEPHPYRSDAQRAAAIKSAAVLFKKVILSDKPMSFGPTHSPHTGVRLSWNQ
jgi:hypothetical protein